MEHYDFSKVVDRRGTSTYKYGALEQVFGRDDVLPLWVADMDFEVCPAITQAIARRICDHPVYGYTMPPESFWQAIIDWQRRFFQEGDEADLRPMILKDIADKTGLDISTISRVSNQKYAQTRWGTFPLRFFFSDGYVTDSGEELSTRKMKVALKEIIDGEDKKKPLSDEALTAKMREKGFPIARRTVAKYREQMGIAVARLRKE